MPSIGLTTFGRRLMMSRCPPVEPREDACVPLDKRSHRRRCVSRLGDINRFLIEIQNKVVIRRAGAHWLKLTKVQQHV